MKVEYNVDIPVSKNRNAGLMAALREFLSSDKHSVALTYDTVEAATYASIQLYRYRKITNGKYRIARRESTVYIIKEAQNAE